MKRLLPILGLLLLPLIALADETAALARLRQSVSNPAEMDVMSNADGTAKEIRMNGPDLSNEDLALFNQLPKLERLTISHAGYVKGKLEKDRTFAGVSTLKSHPSLKYFSAGGAIGKEYLAALAELKNVPELYIQTTHSSDADWTPIGTMKHLTFLGIRVRNDRSKTLTDHLFDQLSGLDNLERFLLSEMTFTDPAPFVKFITGLPKLKELEIKSSNLPDTARAAISKARPALKITNVAGKDEK